MKSSFLIALAILATVLSGCNPAPQSNTTAEIHSDTNPSKGKYAIKSARVEYKTNVMNMAAQQTITFDDFGAKEVIETTMEMMGQTIRTISVTKDGFVYNYDPDKKTGTKTPVGGQPASIDFENLTEEFQKEMNLTKDGEEPFLNKTCTRYLIDSEKMSMKGRFLVWNGIALKTDAQMGGMPMIMEAVKIEENPSVLNSIFEIPADISFM